MVGYSSIINKSLESLTAMVPLCALTTDLRVRRLDRSGELTAAPAYIRRRWQHCSGQQEPGSSWSSSWGSRAGQSGVQDTGYIQDTGGIYRIQRVYTGYRGYIVQDTQGVYTGYREYIQDTRGI